MTSMFIVALLTIARRWNHSECPPTDEQKMKRCTGKNEIMSFIRKWTKLANIIWMR